MSLNMCPAWAQHLTTLQHNLELPSKQVVIAEAVSILSELAGLPRPTDCPRTSTTRPKRHGFIGQS